MLDEIILKPMLTTSEMIEHLKEKNIKFEQMSEKEASKYLEDNNNYFNLTAYKNNFEKKYINKKFVDEYVDLDFAYLKDLSIIDFKLRLLLFDMIVDIEHYLKLKILRLIKNIPNEDGYAVVNKYLDNDYNDPINPQKLHNSILKNYDNIYYSEIFSKLVIDDNMKLENIPIWESLKIITFGELVKFYEYFLNEYNFFYLVNDIYILRDIVRLRNAVAHNDNILTNLGIKDNNYNPNKYVIDFLDKSGIGKEKRKNKLQNSRIRQITYVLYMFNELVTSDGVRESVTKKINYFFFNRVIKHREYYSNNNLLISVYNYFKQIIDTHYKVLQENT